MTEPGMAQDSQLLRPSVMSLAIKDRAGLYAAYMPFVQGGGIFVPGARPCQLGDEVFLLRTLMQDDPRYPVAGTVAGISPATDPSRCNCWPRPTRRTLSSVSPATRCASLIGLAQSS